MPDWDELLARDGPAVWRIAYRIIGNRADADDCFQEAFLAACEFARRSPVRNWPGLLKRLATTRAIDRLRSRVRQASHELVADWGTVRGSEPSPSQSIEDAELSTQLRNALAHLPPKQAECFCLQVLEGWSYTEIASHMEETTDAVGVLLHRARKRLRELLTTPLPTQVQPRSKPTPPVEKLLRTLRNQPRSRTIAWLPLRKPCRGRLCPRGHQRISLSGQESRSATWSQTRPRFQNMP